VSACEHNDAVRLERHYRRTLSGHMEADGKAVTCGRCGDRWFFRDRIQLPDWLRAELIRRGL
jgi:hypothetical protein